tara:strand:- start:964 stop:1179 length:216 start_codon:yes stop_codon:yes gene_type:complete
MKKLFTRFTIVALGIIMLQSCNNIEPQVNLIRLDVEDITRSGIDTLTKNIDTLTKNIDTLTKKIDTTSTTK